MRKFPRAALGLMLFVNSAAVAADVDHLTLQNWARLQQNLETLQIERLQIAVPPYRSTALNIPPERLETDNRAVTCTVSLSPRERRDLLEAMRSTRMIEIPPFEPDMRWGVRFIDPSGNATSTLYLGLRYPAHTNYIVLGGSRAVVSDDVLGWLEKRFFPNAAPDPFFPPAGGCG